MKKGWKRILAATLAVLLLVSAAPSAGIAAVADWRPAACARKKLKKGEMKPFVRLVRNPDVLKTVKCPLKVGFAAETGDPVAEAVRKCRAKNLAFVVANDVTAPGAGFGVDTNRVALVFPDGRAERLPLMSKRTLARRIVAAMERSMAAGRPV